MPNLTDSREHNLAGKRFGLLTALNKDGKKWLCLCQCGAHVHVPCGELNAGRKHCGDRRIHMRRKYLTYRSLHERLERDQGKATSYSCVDCGNRADEWSYQGGAPDELHSPQGTPYTTDQSYYNPRCTPCHTTYDEALLIRPRRDGRYVGGNIRLGYTPKIFND